MRATVPALFILLTAGLSMTLSGTPRADPLRLFAAGSLRLAMDELIDVYAAEHGERLQPVYGPSGALRKQIQGGDVPELFASAAVEHVEALHSAGILRSNTVFARNSLCLIARPGIHLDESNLIDRILDPNLRLGTSTPQFDPAGDYTWQLFRAVDTQRPGAFKTLSEKAVQLTGIAVDKKQKTLPYAAIFEDNKADVFISYCSNAAATSKAVPGLSWMRFPDSVNNSGTYSIGAAKGAGSEADRFIEFVSAARGQSILARYGFQGPAASGSTSMK